MKKLYIRGLVFTGLITAVSLLATAQITGQKIGTNPTTKDASALLELDATNKGVLLPRVALTSLVDVTTVLTPANALTVFNTATTTTGTDDVTPGYYYYKLDAVTPANSRWVRVGGSTVGAEPLQVQGSTTPATLNTENVYQKGNFAIGTQNATGVFNIDAAKDNPATGTPTATNVIDDIIVTPKGNVGFGYSPSDATYTSTGGFTLGLDEKVTYSANGDLDFNYNLATTDPAEAIVHRGIISNGSIGNRTPRLINQSIMAFEAYTSTSVNQLSNPFNLAEQRASMVMRTPTTGANIGGEIWFGTSGYDDDPNNTQQTTAVMSARYRTVMDNKGNWTFGLSPKNGLYRASKQTIDVQLGGIRVDALGYGALRPVQAVQTAQRANYISTDPLDRIVVADALGVLKTIDRASVASPTITADNGLTKTLDNIQLGGALIKPTTLTTDGTNTLAIIGLPIGSVTDNIIVQDNGTGQLKSVAQTHVDLRLVGTNNHITQDAGTGSNGTAIGGSDNVAIGQNTLTANTGIANIAIGANALTSNTTGERNIAIGSGSLAASSASVRNSAVGYFALNGTTTGNNNNAFGYSALRFNTTGSFNTALSPYALFGNTTGNENVGIGYYTMYNNKAGNENVTLGAHTMEDAGTANYNTAVGTRALYLTANAQGNKPAANYNTAIGYKAGGDGSGTALSSGNNNTALGANTAFASSTGSNQLNVANVIFATGASGTLAAPVGNVGIGTSAPSNTLHIKASTNPVRFEGLQPGDASDRIVVADANGVLKTTQQLFTFTGTSTTGATANGLVVIAPSLPKYGSVADATADTSLPSGSLYVMAGAIMIK